MIKSAGKTWRKDNKTKGRGRGGELVKPLVLLGIGNTRIEEWIKNFFQEQAVIEVSSSDQTELKERIAGLRPDILVIMRQNSMGGVPDAGSLAADAAPEVSAVLLIVGELDAEGREMFNQAKDSGVQHIITCEKGGQIYGDELVYTLTGMIKEIISPEGVGERPGPKEDILNGEARKTLDSLFQSAGNIGKAIFQSAETVSGRVRAKSAQKRTRPKLNKAEGISLNYVGNPATPANTDPTAIVPGGMLALVTPWRPGLAGRMAAQAVKILAEESCGEVAYVGASKNSTGALWLDVAEEELMMSDWRVPGSNFPVMQGNIKIYAVDPVKDLQPAGEEELWSVVKDARKASTYTVVDFAGNMAMAQRAVRQGRSVVLVVLPGNDPVELRVSNVWIKNLMDGNCNIITGIDVRGMIPEIPGELNPKVVIRNNPADALTVALKKQDNNIFKWV